MIPAVIGIFLVLAGTLGDPQLKQQFLDAIKKAQGVTPAT